VYQCASSVAGQHSTDTGLLVIAGKRLAATLLFFAICPQPSRSFAGVLLHAPCAGSLKVNAWLCMQLVAGCPWAAWQAFCAHAWQHVTLACAHDASLHKLSPCMAATCGMAWQPLTISCHTMLLSCRRLREWSGLVNAFISFIRSAGPCAGPGKLSFSRSGH
jgi:hypothetical protein